MAGKAKKKDDSGAQSKTARASMRTGGGPAAYIASADASRIVPLGGGTHAYLLDPRNGKTLRFKVSSDEFVDTLRALVDAGFGDRIRRDLAELAGRYPTWEPISARLDAPVADTEAEEVVPATA